MQPARDRVTVLGGGNGISAVLRGIARRIREGAALDLTAVVATADDGGSSGRLREERGGIPPGDLRNCLLALASDEAAPLARLFAHRYEGRGDLAGHALGNLILAALADQHGSYLRSVEVAAGLLGAFGRVLPASLDALHLEGLARDGIRISGESRIGRSHCAVDRVWLVTPGASPAPGVVESVQDADLLVLGPGSLFTSLLAVLLVPGVADAVRRSRGRKVLVANLMTQPGETLGMGLAEHLQALELNAGAGLVDEVLVHGGSVDPERVRPYEDQGAEPLDTHGLEGRPERLLVGDVATSGGKIRHDPDAVAALLLSRLG
jgi:uncharacterized cofD-like protein